MEAQQQLFGLMVVAEEHQKAVKAALDGLTAERAALAKERVALSQAAARVAGVADGVKRAAEEAIPAIQKAAEEAIGASVTQSLAGGLSGGRQSAWRGCKAGSRQFVGRRAGGRQCRRLAQARRAVVRLEVGHGGRWRASGRVPGGVCLAGVATAPGQVVGRGKGRAGC